MMWPRASPSLSQLLLLIGLAQGQAHILVASVAEHLAYDEHDKLRKHTLLYNAACQEKGYLDGLEYSAEYWDLGVTTDARLVEKRNDNDPECQAVCLERGVDRSVAHAVLPTKHFPSRPSTGTASTGTKESNNYDLDTNGFRTWFRDECVRVEVCFINYASPEIATFWIHPRTRQRQEHMKVEFGERYTKCFMSFIGHEFDVVDSAATKGNGQQEAPLLARVTVQHMTTMAFGKAPPSGELKGNATEKIHRTLMNEWNRHQVVTRTFSPLGFQKGRLPEDIFAQMGAFYYNNRHNKVHEEWTGRGVFVNWWESNVSFIQIPWRAKLVWQARLQDMVQAWAGVPVEQTVMYGLRQYEQGARLLTHVDRERTHAVSLIVNVAQGNLTADWPIEVLDHADRLHEIIMEPGDVVYYESAKCLHGRNRPLQGGYYVNLFTHYRPVADDEWLTRENPPETPEPVLAMEGTCRVLATATGNGGNGGNDGQDQSRKEVVECDDTRLGSYVSPSLFQARNGQDLFDWWRRTSPDTANAPTDEL